MDTDIHQYRAPMVTAIGIILGFVLGFMGHWATSLPAGGKTPSTSDHFIATDFLVLGGGLTGITLLTISLYRILNNRVPREKMESYYYRTLQLFIAGVCLSFAGTFFAILQFLLEA